MTTQVCPLGHVHGGRVELVYVLDRVDPATVTTGARHPRGNPAWPHVGTPVLDVKPWMEEFGPRGTVRQPEWSRQLMAGYWGQP